MAERFTSHYRGVLLTLIAVVAVLWLAATGQLTLYIHPRYVVFTVILTAIAGMAAIGALVLLPGSRDEDEMHEHPEGEAESRTGRAWAVGRSTAVVLGCAGALLVLPPATLTSSTAAHRDLNQLSSSADTVELSAGDGSGYTVREWATLLRQGNDAASLAASRPDLTGFVTADPEDPENVFYIVRFVVTHCTLDAQPVGVPVYLPEWETRFPVDSWVHASGTFVDNPDVESDEPVVLKPSEITAVEQPADPYVY
ncbi:TIGR03943 family protein [Salinibacterium sp. ZJ70]|uniref:TIGR03943 family putative permease subunit n=1 Tax=Salinibacterium sp. ZJ70 TaxID=2708084 RepID=UPI0014227691|nr:TIGR03943 family protein [Salinibacterium sp. ZJ70]